MAVFERGQNAAMPASWSTMRAAVAFANACAFAWRAPAFSVSVSGDEDTAVLIEKVMRGAKTAKYGTWLRSAYGGEPNITKAKTPQVS
jgi:hypothetical protein